MTRYVVIGAGAIGGALGGRLTHAGRETVLVARGDHLRALQQSGLRLRSPSGDLTIPVTAVGGPDELELRPDDVLVVATKTQQAEAALVTWADAPVDGATAGERLPVLLALNGVASETMALRYFRRVYGVCVWMPSVHLEPGEVILRASGPSGMLHLGRVPAQLDDTDRRLLDQVAADWTAADYDVPRPDDVMAWKYRKLLSNLGNIFQALVHTNGDPAPLVARAGSEARTVLDRAGIAYVDDEEERAARSAGFTMTAVPGVPSDIGGSTWQSLQRGTGNVETDYLNGEIALIAHRTGQEAPINASLAILARQAARTGVAPGDLSADELAQRLGIALSSD